MELNKLQQLKGIDVKIQSNLESTGGGSSSRTYYLADGATLSLQANGQFRSKNNLYVLNYSTSHFLMRKKEFYFKTPFEKLEIEIDGKQIHINSNVSLEFKDLSIKSSNFDLMAQIEGKIFFTKDEGLTISIQK